jgi:hypothetical protein
MASRFGEIKTALSVHNDQLTFVKAISRVYPRFWEDLRATVLPNFPDTVPLGSRHGGYYTNPALAAIHRSFGEWTRRFHIESVLWLQSVALKGLQLWKKSPDAPYSALHCGSPVDCVPSELDFRWEPHRETADAFIRRVKDRVASHKKAFGDSFEKCPPSIFEKHAEWLALHQFGELSRYDIRDREKYAGDGSVCEKGWKAAAKRLGITPLKLSTGRRAATDRSSRGLENRRRSA